MKKWLKVAGLVGISMIMFATGAFSASHLKQIKANLNSGLNFKVDGVEWSPEKLPITYEGYTYLPLRETANLVGKAVDYDAETMTVILGEKTDQVPMNKIEFDNVRRAEISRDPDIVNYDGSFHDDSIYLYTEGIGRNYSQVDFLVKNAYQTMSLDLVITSGEETNLIVEGLKDKDGKETIVLRNVQITPDDGVQNIYADIAEFYAVKVYIDSEDYKTTKGLILPSSYVK